MDILKTIQEAATWIEKVNTNFEVNLYRTPELTPERHLHLIGESHQTAVVEEVVNRRSKLLEEAKIDLIPIEELHRYGRIVAFDINSSLYDGAPQVESENFVDIYETPPVDTWLTIGKQLIRSGVYHTYNSDFKQSVIAWVPKSQYFYVEQAALVSIVDNIYWLEPNSVANSFNLLKPLFEPPIEFQKPHQQINRGRRELLMLEYEKKLDKNEETFNNQHAEENITQSIEFNWEISGIRNLWNWFSKLLART